MINLFLNSLGTPLGARVWDRRGDIRPPGPAFSGHSTCLVEAGGRAHAALEAALEPGVPEGGGLAADTAEVELTMDRAEELAIEVSAAQPGILVVSDSYDAGWHAYVDGASAPMLKVNGLFRGVYIPAGRHSVVFTYAPLSVTIGLLITAGGLLGSFVWVVIAMFRNLFGAYQKRGELRAANTPGARAADLQELSE